VAAAVGGFVDQVVDELEQVVASDNHRTKYRPDAAHGWQCTTVRLARIGRMTDDLGR
jgi:hypothetical protein